MVVRPDPHTFQGLAAPDSYISLFILSAMKCLSIHNLFFCNEYNIFQFAKAIPLVNNLI
jgi:hypothetical protein